MRGILGADVFINLLLVFIITTGLLLMNTNKAAIQAQNKAKERNMPAIRLAQGSAHETPAGGLNKPVTLSARKQGETIQYFLEKQPVQLKDLAAELKAKKAAAVRIRVDERIAYGTYVNLLDLCTRAGVKDIINVYQSKN